MSTNRLQIWIVLVGSMIFLSMAGIASADCTETSPDNWECVGPDTNPADTDTGTGPDTVTIQAGGQSRGSIFSDGPSITVHNDGEVIDTVYGVASTNGDVHYDGSGDINSNSHGIRAVGNVTVSGSGDIEGDYRGIAGGGDITVSTSGEISGSAAIEGGNSSQTIEIQDGTLTGGSAGAIFALGGDDTVNINIETNIEGVIDGGSDFDTLVFTLESTNQTELDAFNTFMGGVQLTDGTLTYNGRTFTWLNFEELASIVELIVEQEIAAAGGGSSAPAAAPVPMYNEVRCPNVKVFLTPDGFVQVYSAFDMIVPDGFLVAVFSLFDATAGDVFALDDLNTPAWSVLIAPGNNLHVLNENGEVVGNCFF